MPRTDTREHTEGREDREVTVAATTAPCETAVGGELFYQRCLWCGTAAYHRPFCRACGSVAFRRERSEGSGVVLRRNGHVPLNTWFVAMDEGFNLLCQVTGTAPVAVRVGAKVSVVRPVAPLGQSLPLVELTESAPPPACWW
ncbi:Zn-ribbon domain-containing OB-fold protein [Streptomyces sp. NPDC087903]|uniref:Zn-ribbon domain-containing OB-fold protein n=1 Tax=Streptomyces sp. NPDC087903 TaxID=3365819 RepID=UPI0037FA1171